MGRLDGKVAFLTGAGSGIARATAHRFAAEGAKVVVVEFDEASGQRTATIWWPKVTTRCSCTPM